MNGMRAKCETDHVVAHDLQNQQWLAGASEVMMPQIQADVGAEPLALLVHARRFVDPLWVFTPLYGRDEVFQRLRQPLTARKPLQAVPYLPANVDGGQRSLARTKSRRLIGAYRSCGSSGSSGTGRQSPSAQPG
jgi:hypothetical protein